MAQTKNRMKKYLAVILAVVLVIVGLQNTEVVETRILFATVAMPRAVLLILAALIGFCLCLLTRLFKRQKSSSSQ